MGGSSKRYRNNQFARACGLVCVRQRPGTVNGVMFMTLRLRLKRSCAGT
nr:hypothetical protein [Paraburkholderia sp. UCT2]